MCKALKQPKTEEKPIVIDKEKTEVEKLQERLEAKEKELQEWRNNFDSRVDQFRRKEYYRPHNLYNGIIKESVISKLV